MSDIVDWLRELAAEYAAHDDHGGQVRLIQAADVIEGQRCVIANWEAAWAVQRGSLSRNQPADSAPAIILPAEPNTPR